VDVTHDERHGGLGTGKGGWDGIVARGWVVDDALEAEDSEMPPAGGEVCIGYFLYAREGHRPIIRLGVHGD
jgi:hypothetical protein